MFTDKLEFVSDGYVCPTTNMVAAVNTDAITERLLPKNFGREDDLEVFIRQCELYFLTRGINNVKEQEKLVICLLDTELIGRYMKTADKVVGFQARLKMAFQKEKNILEAITGLAMFKRGHLEMEEFIKKAESLVNNIFDHKDFSRETVLAKLLINASDNVRLREEVVLRKLSTVEEIKETLTLLEKIEEKNEFVNVVRQYGTRSKEAWSRTVQSSNGTRDSRQRSTREIECWSCKQKGHTRSQCTKGENRVCWICNKVGHISKDCRKKGQIKCFGCGDFGHIQRECGKMRCFKCNRLGNKSEECNKMERSTRENSGKYQGGQRNRYNYFNTIEDDDDDQQEEEIEEREAEIRHPNARAPPREELAGARL